jgi:hypothetical protein
MARYWVGGSGNWDASDTTHWSDSSGGAGGQSVPGSGDDVIFDLHGNEPGDTAYTVTVTADATCRGLDISFTGTTKVTFTGAAARKISIYGNVYFSGGTAQITNTFAGTLEFANTSGTVTFNPNGVTIAGPVKMNGVGGTLQFTGTVTATNKNITCTEGSLDTNSQTVTCDTMDIATTFDGLTLGNSTINCTGGGFKYQASVTPSVGNSIIKVTGAGAFWGNGKTYYEVQLNGTSHNVTGSNTYTTLTRTGTATLTDSVTFPYSGTQTITGTLTLTGNSATKRLLVSSDIRGSAATLNAHAISVDKVDFLDITGTGDATWDMSAAAGYTGNCGGNTMQALGAAAFTSPITCYWVHGATTNTYWSGATGGNCWFANDYTTGVRVPLPQDSAVFDTHAFAADGKTVTQDMPRIPGFTFADTDQAFTFTTSADAWVFGSVILDSNMTLTASTNQYTLMGRGSYVIDSAGKTWAKNIAVVCVSGTYTLNSDLTTGATNIINLQSGTFTVVNGGTSYVFTGKIIIQGATVDLGSATHICNGTSNAFTYSSGTLSAASATIKFTDSSNTALTFAGGGQSYGKVWFARGTSTATNTISGNNVIGEFKDDGTIAHTDAFTALTWQKIATFTVSGGAGALITLNSVTAGSPFYLYSTAGNISRDYLNLQDSVVGGSGTWTAGANSTFGTNNHGWADLPVAPKRYWVTGGDGNWSNTNNWSTSDGGGSGASVPTGECDVYFTATSGGGDAVVGATPVKMNNLDMSGFTGRLTDASSGAMSIYGNMTFGAGMTMTYTGAITIMNTFQAHTLTFAGKAPNSVTYGSIAPTDISADTFTIADAYATSFGTFSLVSGTLDMNNQSGTLLGALTSTGNGLRTLLMRTGTLTSDTTTTIVSFSGSNFTFTPATSCIKATCPSNPNSAKTFAGGGFTFYDVWFAIDGTIGTGITITGSNTFHDFKDTGNAAHTIKFTAGTTQTVTTFSVNGSAGKEISINSQNTQTHTLTKAGGGTITCSYLNIQHSIATPGSTWNANNSTDNNSVATAGSGWTISAGGSGPVGAMLLMGAG